LISIWRRRRREKHHTMKLAQPQYVCTR